MTKKKTPAQAALDDPAALWNQADALKEALPWLYAIAKDAAKSGPQKLLAAQLPELLPPWEISVRADAAKSACMDEMRSDFMRSYDCVADAKVRAKAKGDPHQ